MALQVTSLILSFFISQCPFRQIFFCASGLDVNGTTRYWRIVVAAVLVLVSKVQISSLLETDDPERTLARRNYNWLGESLQNLRQRALVPNVEHVLPGRDTGNHNAACTIGHAEIRSFHDNHDCAHLGMDVAEDIADSPAVKAHGAACARLIETEVKALTV